MTHRLACALLLLAACGDDAPSDAVAADAGDLDDASRPPDAFVPDAFVPSPGCDAITLDESFPIAPGLATTIHPAAVFDGEALWVTVTAVEEGTSVFDIFLVRLGCDGRQGEPIRVSDTPMLSDIDGALARRSDGVLVTWQADAGTGILETWVRLHDAETGAPLGDAARVQTTRGGAPLETALISPSLVAGETGFDLVGARFVEDATAFQAYVQPFDALGAPMGDALEPAFVAMADQTEVTAARTPAGLVLAWTQEPATGSPAVMAQLPGMDPVAVPTGTIESSAPTLAVAGDTAWLALSAGGGSSRDLHLLPAGGDAVTTLPSPGATDVAPALAAGQGASLALGWLRVIAGFRNDLFVRRVDLEPAVVAAAPIEIPTTGDAYAYPIDVTHVREDVFFITWVEGETVDGERQLRVAGRFVQL